MEAKFIDVGMLIIRIDYIKYVEVTYNQILVHLTTGEDLEVVGKENQEALFAQLIKFCIPKEEL